VIWLGLFSVLGGALFIMWQTDVDVDRWRMPINSSGPALSYL
jgi:hypothetical protein